MDFAKVLARLRKESGYTQVEVADFISKNCGRQYSFKNISHWETAVSAPAVEQFLLLCELYSVQDVLGTFRGSKIGFRGLPELNNLGKSRVEEYIALLCGNAIFTEAKSEDPLLKQRRIIKLYDVPVAAGAGNFLDSDSYEEFELDETMPVLSDFAVKVSGDSMTPRFIDGQIVFIKEQQTLDIGEIGIFELDGDAYIKKLGNGELISLNPRYQPLKIHDYNSFHLFGKVVG
ncbi:MAG: LexA family transcriptional regulator [Clostridiales bacterium]|jgi:SOS-response transcriptional repressor LexA|nr:LexA family transcriptional regulator [Clostridiales bacterium]